MNANNWAIFYKENFETVYLLDITYLERIHKKMKIELL